MPQTHSSLLRDPLHMHQARTKDNLALTSNEDLTKLQLPASPNSHTPSISLANHHHCSTSPTNPIISL
jgi:hypothetical protein